MFSVGRMPPAAVRRASRARPQLDGVRIGVVREYMDKTLFTEMDHETIDLVEPRARPTWRRSAHAIVDPGPARRPVRRLPARATGRSCYNGLFTRQFAETVPCRRGRQADDRPIATLVGDDARSVARARGADAAHAARRRGDGREPLHDEPLPRGARRRRDHAATPTSSRSRASTTTRSFPIAKRARERQEHARGARHVATAWARRFAVQQLVLQCMSLMGLDALAYPTSNLPPPKLGAPGEPAVNGRGSSWSMLGREGFPAMTVPAGFTTDGLRSRARSRRADPRRRRPGGGGDGATAEGTHVVGPTPAELPVGIDFVARAVRRADAAAHRVGVRSRDEAPPPAAATSGRWPASHRQRAGGGVRSTSLLLAACTSSDDARRLSCCRKASRPPASSSRRLSAPLQLPPTRMRTSGGVTVTAVVAVTSRCPKGA